MKEKVALAVFSNDWHLKKENIPQIIDLVEQQCKLAKYLEAGYLVVLGDIFESRVAQREEVLTTFSKILEIVADYGLKMWVIPGNHDKTVYSSKESFLTPYKDHPCFQLVQLSGGIPFPKHQIYLRLLPFFEENVWIDKFKELCNYIGEDGVEQGDKNILCTHIAVTGSRNNDGQLVSSGISTKAFKNFYKVFSGHYHDQQKIGENFYHLPSIQQNNFGENSDKGFTVLYSDGNHELIKSKFREYLKIEIDLDITSFEDLDKLKRLHTNSDKNIRFEVRGSENALKSLKKEDFTMVGIDLKTKSKEIENDIKYSSECEVKEHTASTIKEDFILFCEENKLDVNKGMVYLNQILK